MRRHAFHTFRILDPIPAFHVIKQWAACHHERLDGSGYPFGLQEDTIPVGAQIMAVADIFTALSEDRPYRTGFAKDSVLEIMAEMAGTGALSQDIIVLLGSHYREIDNERVYAQRLARNECKILRSEVMNREEDS